MALSAKAQRLLETALAAQGIYNDAAQEIIDAINGVLVEAVAAHVAALGALAALSASNFTAAIPAEPTKAEIDVGINALAAKVDTKIGLVQAKLDAFLAAQVAAGQMEA